MLYPNNKLLSINGLPAVSENGKVFVLSPGRKKIISVSEEKASLIPAEYYGAVYPYGPLNDPEKYYLTIVVTPACNLNCKYCSLSVGRGTGLVSVQSVEDYFRLIVSSRPEKTIIVAFFGGEPTLERERLARLTSSFHRIAEEKSKSIQFTMTTNGTFDDSVLELILANNISVLYSMDGPAEIQNTQRSNSHRIVERNLIELINNDVSVTISSVVTSYSVKMWKDLADYFLNIGVKDLQYNAVCPFPWSDAYKKGERQFLRPTVDEYVESAFSLYLYGIKNHVHFSNPIYSHLFHPSRYYCDLQAGFQSLLINYNGDILSCAEIQDQHHPQYKSSLIGNINDMKIFPANKPSESDKPSACAHCSLKYICCSGCPKRASIIAEGQQLFDSFFCDSSKKLVERLIRHFSHTLV